MILPKSCHAELGGVEFGGWVFDVAVGCDAATDEGEREGGEEGLSPLARPVVQQFSKILVGHVLAEGGDGGLQHRGDEVLSAFLQVLLHDIGSDLDGAADAIAGDAVEVTAKHGESPGEAAQLHPVDGGIGRAFHQGETLGELRIDFRVLQHDAVVFGRLVGKDAEVGVDGGRAHERDAARQTVGSALGGSPEGFLLQHGADGIDAGLGDIAKFANDLEGLADIVTTLDECLGFRRGGLPPCIGFRTSGGVADHGLGEIAIHGNPDLRSVADGL